MLKISHLNTFYFLRYVHVKYAKSLFTNILKQQNRIYLKLAYFLRNLRISRENNWRILRSENAKFSWYCFYMNTNIQGDLQICISVPLSTVHISQNDQNKIHNLQIRLEQSTDQTKKAKKYQLVGIALFIHDNTKSPQT